MAKMTTLPLDCEIPVEAAHAPLWPELFWGLEWLELRLSPLYRGERLVRGGGEVVVAVPGFLAGDDSLRELRSWLERIGYTPLPSGIGRNSDCPDVMLGDLLRTVEAAWAQSGQRVRIIGHSLGGTLARAAAVQRPDLIAQVITLGSPVVEVRVHPLVIALSRIVSAATASPDLSPRRHSGHVHDGSCACELMGALAAEFPAAVARTSIYSRTDGIVDWRSSFDASAGSSVEVRATHLGMPVNAQVYAEIARELASVAARESPRPERRESSEEVMEAA